MIFKLILFFIRFSLCFNVYYICFVSFTQKFYSVFTSRCVSWLLWLKALSFGSFNRCRCCEWFQITTVFFFFVLWIFMRMTLLNSIMIESIGRKESILIFIFPVANHWHHTHLISDDRSLFMQMPMICKTLPSLSILFFFVCCCCLKWICIPRLFKSIKIVSDIVYVNTRTT